MAPAAADEARPPVPGDSVRVTLLDADRALRGRFAFVDSTSLGIMVDPGEAPRTLLRPSVMGLEVLRSRTHAVRGGILGFAGGGVLGLVWAGEIAEQEAVNPLTGFVTGAVLGTAAGVLIGHRSRDERWEPAAHPWPAGGPAFEPGAGVAIAAAESAGAPVRVPARLPVVEPGDRVRFTILARVPAEGRDVHPLDPGTRLDGRLLFVTPDTMAWYDREVDQPRLVPRASVGGVEQGTVRGTRALRGAAIGLLIGAAGGLALGLAGQEEDMPLVPMLTAYGGLAGLGVGAFVGSHQRIVHWNPATLPEGPAGFPAQSRSASFAAHAPMPPGPGDHVRITSTTHGTLVGTLYAVDAQGLEVDDDEDSRPRLTLSRASIESIEVERRHSRAALGGIVGFVVGGISARAIHAEISSHEDFSDVPISSFILGGAIGAMAGSVIGRSFKHDRWHEASLP